MERMLAQKLVEMEINELTDLLEKLNRTDRDAYSVLKELIDDLI
jgi:arginase family enzyme